MSKKMYMKPEMKAVFLQQKLQLLQVSSVDGEGMQWNSGGISSEYGDR